MTTVKSFEECSPSRLSLSILKMKRSQLITQTEHDNFSYHLLMVFYYTMLKVVENGCNIRVGSVYSKYLANYKITADALMHFYSICRKLPLLRSCFAEKPLEYHQENLRYGLHRMVARILPFAHGIMPLLVG